MAFSSSYTEGLIQQSEYYYGVPSMEPGLSGSFSGSFQGDGSALTGISGGGGNGTLIASGSVTASTDPATGFVVKASGSTLLDVQGSLGSMFSVSDSFDGNLFEVNNISGISLLSVSSSGDVDIPKGVLTVSGSVSASKFLGDGSQLTGVGGNAFPFTGDAQITGSLIVSGSFIPHGKGNIDGVIIGEGAAHIGTGALNTGHVAIGDTAQANMFGVAIGASATAGVDNISIGYKAGANHGTNSRGQIAIGTEVQPTTNADKSINFSANDQNISPFSPSEPKTFGVYLGSATANSPDLKFMVGPNSSSYWSGSGNFGFNTKTPDASLTVYDSGSTVFSVVGSTGTLFEVDDSLTGTIFTANDASGLPILQADSTGEVYLGKSPQSLYTTRQISSTVSTHTESIYQIDTSSLFTSAVFDYTCVSQSNAAAGQIRAVWIPGTDLISFTDNAVSDIGTTVDVRLSVEITQSKASFLSKTNSAGWQIKTIIRSI